MGRALLSVKLAPTDTFQLWNNISKCCGDVRASDRAAESPLSLGSYQEPSCWDDRSVLISKHWTKFTTGIIRINWPNIRKSKRLLSLLIKNNLNLKTGHNNSCRIRIYNSFIKSLLIEPITVPPVSRTTSSISYTFWYKLHFWICMFPLTFFALTLVRALSLGATVLKRWRRNGLAKV